MCRSLLLMSGSTCVCVTHATAQPCIIHGVRITWVQLTASSRGDPRPTSTRLHLLSTLTFAPLLSAVCIGRQLAVIRGNRMTLSLSLSRASNPGHRLLGGCLLSPGPPCVRGGSSSTADLLKTNSVSVVFLPNEMEAISYRGVCGQQKQCTSHSTSDRLIPHEAHSCGCRATQTTGMRLKFHCQGTAGKQELGRMCCM